MSASQTPPHDGGELQRVDSFQWPSGHVGHLTSNQKSALEQFKSLCQSKGYFSPGDDSTPASHDDETLLRYLRARKFVPQDALGQFKDTETWRLENGIDNLYETIDVEEYEQTRRLYPQWTGRRDKRGIPFYVFEVAHLDAKEVTAYEKDSDRKNKDKDGQVPLVSKVPRKMLRLFALYENLCRFVLPLCSAVPDRANPETPVSQSSNIVDISKVGLRQFWNLRAHLQDSSRLATAHYPETLDRIFVVGAPSFFPTIWDWAKRWFDPITVQKISILGQSDTLSTLTKFVDIDNIPKKYGGNLEWSFGDMPNLDSGIANCMQWNLDLKNKAGFRTLPIGPIKWRYNSDGGLEAVEAGTQTGQPRQQVIAVLPHEAHVARLALSPGRNPQSKLSAGASGAGAASAASQDRTQDGTTPAAPAPSITNTSSNKNLDTVDSRQGTSSTRYEQQASTHAHGTLADGTPEVRGVSHSSHSVMEPRTVAQAPKHTPLYNEEDGAGDSNTVLAQAQQYAGQTLETVKTGTSSLMNAVGLGGEQSKTEDAADQAPATKAEDPRVDEMESHKVEEYIRSQHMSLPQSVPK